MAETTSTPPEINTTAVYGEPTPQKPPQTQRKCPSCGGTDHVRRSSKKCTKYVGPAGGNAENSEEKNDAPTSTAPNTTNIAPPETTDTESSASIPADNNNDASSNDNSATDSAEEVNISKPNFIRLENPTAPEYKPVVDVSSKAFNIQGCLFKVIERDHRDRKREIPAEPHILMERFFSFGFMTRFVVSTNKYIANRRQALPDLYCWKDSKVSEDVTLSNMFQFFAILFYFGIVELPSKSDYWSTKEWMPQHSIVS